MKDIIHEERNPINVRSTASVSKRKVPLSWPTKHPSTRTRTHNSVPLLWGWDLTNTQNYCHVVYVRVYVCAGNHLCLFGTAVSTAANTHTYTKEIKNERKKKRKKMKGECVCVIHIRHSVLAQV